MRIRIRKQYVYAAIVGAHLADLYHVSRENKVTFTQMKAKLVEADETIKSLNDQMRYLVALLKKNGVELDEFDFMALPNVRRRDENRA
jgi:SMC interacting uncharacterized protein involved in chromosome segregation